MVVAPVSRGDDLKCQGLAVQALKSSSDTLGSFLTKATMVQITRSGTSMLPRSAPVVGWVERLRETQVHMSARGDRTAWLAM
jgi:hypothetical protein